MYIFIFNHFKILTNNLFRYKLECILPSSIIIIFFVYYVTFNYYKNIKVDILLFCFILLNIILMNGLIYIDPILSKFKYSMFQRFLLLCAVGIKNLFANNFGHIIIGSIISYFIARYMALKTK